MVIETCVNNKSVGIWDTFGEQFYSAVVLKDNLGYLESPYIFRKKEQLMVNLCYIFGIWILVHCLLDKWCKRFFVIALLLDNQYYDNVICERLRLSGTSVR